ncbi:unnamed protein product [Rotaria socialis]
MAQWSERWVISDGDKVSNDLTVSQCEQQRHVIKYVLEKLENYAHKSDLWYLIHASHLRRKLLRRSARVSKQYSISEDLVRKCIHQIFVDVDQYVTQLHQLICEQKSDTLIVLLDNINKKNTAWYSMQIERARRIFPTQQHLEDNELLENYYIYIRERLTPKQKLSNATEQKQACPNFSDLNIEYQKANNTGKEYLKHVIQNFRERTIPDLRIIDEMVNLGIADMKTFPSKEDFETSNSFLGKVLIFHRIKEAYKTTLQNTSDDFMLLRFGKSFGYNASKNIHQINKQFSYLLHSFLKSIVILFACLTAGSNDSIISVISKIDSLCLFDYDSSVMKMNIDLFSPESNIDQWTWLLERWHDTLRTMPILLTRAGAFSRVVRTTIGIGLVHLGKCAEMMVTTECTSMSTELLNEQLFHALQTGFYFGVAYGIVDCLQVEKHILDNVPLDQFLIFDNKNSQTLTSSKTIDKCLSRMEQLLSGTDFDRSQLPDNPFASMLVESFDNLLILTKSNNTMHESFNELALLLRS